MWPWSRAEPKSRMREEPRSAAPKTPKRQVFACIFEDGIGEGANELKESSRAFPESPEDARVSPAEPGREWARAD